MTGQPAIQHDLEPVLSSDLRRGEAIALPIALLILLAVLGVSLVALVPFVFAACTITLTLTVLYVIAQHFSMVSYVTNLVELIGLGLAVDYSLLVVYRFREELDRADTTDAAIVRTIATRGTRGRLLGRDGGDRRWPCCCSCRCRSSARSASAASSCRSRRSPRRSRCSRCCSRSLGRRGARRVPVAASVRSRLGLRLPVLPGTVDVENGFWARLARAIMRRPVRSSSAGRCSCCCARRRRSSCRSRRARSRRCRRSRSPCAGSRSCATAPAPAR